jgi:hypothetical protein
MEVGWAWREITKGGTRNKRKGDYEGEWIKMYCPTLA